MWKCGNVKMGICESRKVKIGSTNFSYEDDSIKKTSQKFNDGIALIKSETNDFFAHKLVDQIHFCFFIGIVYILEFIYSHLFAYCFGKKNSFKKILDDYEGKKEDEKFSIASSALERYQILQHFYREAYFLLKGDKSKKTSRNDVIENFFKILQNHERIDGNGANICHVAYLYKNYTIGFELVKKYPGLAVRGYSNSHLNHDDEIGNYTGENILHMCIMNGDYDEAGKLLKHFETTDVSNLKILLSGYASGYFFGKKNLNAGNYPLHFAACSNDKNIFDLVFNFYVKYLGLGSIFWRDSDGNTVYHLCIIHNLLDQSQHVLRKLATAVKNEIKRQYIDSHYHGAKADYVEIKYVLEEHQPDDIERVPPQLYNEYRKILRDIKFPLPKEDNGSLEKLDDNRLDAWVEDQTYRLVLRKRVFDVLNNDGLSPLTIAANGDGKPIEKGDDNYEEKRLKKKELFQEFLENLKRTHWTYGTSQHYHLNLYGLEIPYDSNNYQASEELEFKSAIQILCELRSEECLLVPDIKDIIENKWNKFGFYLFVIKCLGNLVVTVLITFTAFFVNATPDLTSKALDYGGILSADIVMSITGIILFLYSFDFYIFFWYRSLIRGASIFDMWCSFFTLISYGIFSVSKVVAYQNGHGNNYQPSEEEVALGLDYNRQDHWLQKLSISVCLLGAYAWIFFFWIGFKYTGTFVLIISRIFMSNIRKWICLFGVVIVAFSCAISVLTNIGDPGVYYGIRHFLFVLWNLIKQAFGVQNFNEMDAYGAYYRNFIPEDLIWILEIIQTSFQFIMTVLMLNLLIAMINDSYNDLTKNSEALLLLERYNIMQGLEVRYKVALSFYYNFKAFVSRICHRNMSHRYQAKSDHDLQMDIWKIYTTVMPSLTIDGIDGADSNRIFERTHFDPDGFANLNKMKRLNRKEKIALLIIDAQKDFHDIPPPGAGSRTAAHTSVTAMQTSVAATQGYKYIPSLKVLGSNDDYIPALKVLGSSDDANRIATMIRENRDLIDKVFLTKDTHEPYHIANAVFWKFECNLSDINDFNSKVLEKDTFFLNAAFELNSKGWKVSFEFQPCSQLRRLEGCAVKATVQPCGSKVILLVAGKKPAFEEWLSNFDIASDQWIKKYDTVGEMCVVDYDDETNSFTATNVKSKQSLKLKPRNSDKKVFEWVKNYVKLLKCQGKNKLTLWPQHCIKVKCILARSRKFWNRIGSTAGVAEFESIKGDIDFYGNHENATDILLTTASEVHNNIGNDSAAKPKFTVNKDFIKDRLKAIFNDHGDIIHRGQEISSTEVKDDDINAVIDSAKYLVEKMNKTDEDGFTVWDDDLFESTWNTVKDHCKREDEKRSISEFSGVFRFNCLPNLPTTEDSIQKYKLAMVKEFVSDGHNIVQPIQEALDDWYGRRRLIEDSELEDNLPMDIIEKGSNWRTDVYSALKAEVEVKMDPSTSFNYLKLDEMKAYDRIIICGQASTHSVKEMVMDIVRDWNFRERGRIYILKDGMSPLKDFMHSQRDFFNFCIENDVVMTTADKVFAKIKEDYEKERESAMEKELYKGKLDLILNYLKTIESQV